MPEQTDQGSNSPLPSIPKEEWEKSWCQIPQSNLNKLILDHFIYHGLKEIAEVFASEHNMPYTPSKDLELRNKISENVNAGDLSSLITDINNINISLLDTTVELLYRIKQHKIAELSYSYYENDKNGFEDILNQIQIELAPIVKVEKQLHGEMVQLLGYVVFNDGNIMERRSVLAKEINKAICGQHGKYSDRLDDMIERMEINQNVLKEVYEFPRFDSYIKKFM